MIVVHHLEQSRSERIVWLLEELALPYEIKRYRRDPKTSLAPAELRRVHPLGKAPIVVDEGRTLVESGAIIEALLDRHGAASGLRPAPGSEARTAYDTFLHLAEGSLMPPLLMRLIFSTMASRSPALLRPLVKAVTAPVEAGYLRPTLDRLIGFCEGELAARPWFAGEDFTAADIQMSFPLRMARQRAGLDASSPHLAAWLERIKARPARQRAMAAIGE